VKTSIIIATNKRPETLRECLDSFIGQSILPDEVIISHGGGDTRTKDIAKKYKYASLNIKYLNKGDLGSARQRNIAAVMAKGDILVFLDDDVICETDFIKEILEPFKVDVKNEIAGVSGVCVNLSYKPLSYLNRCLFELCLGKGERKSSYAGMVVGPAVNFYPGDKPNSLKEVQWMPSCCSAYRKDIFLKNKFNEKFYGYSFMEDVDLSLRVLKKYKLINTTKARIFHKDMGSQTHRNWTDIGKMQVLNRWHIMTDVLGKNSLSYKLKFFYFQIYSTLGELRLLMNAKYTKSTLLRWLGRIKGCLALLSMSPRRKTHKKTIIYEKERLKNITEEVLLSHSGKQHSYRLAVSLQELGSLKQFITSSYYAPGRFPDKILSQNKDLDMYLKKRNIEGLSERVKRFPVFELPEFFLRNILGISKAAHHAVFLRDMLFDKFVAGTQIKDCSIFWGFQGSSYDSLKKATTKGIKTVVELATAHVSAAIEILGHERDRSPEWADSITNLYFPEWYIERLKAEPFLSDYQVVASEFSKKTLVDAGVNAANILLLPLGTDIAKFVSNKRSEKGPLKILFVGGVGQRKGIKYLLEAVKNLHSDNINLKIIGGIAGSGRALKQYHEYYEYLGRLTHEKTLEIMNECDCLVLPSLFEGFGLVIPEAMASGMPVIASTHSAAPEIIREEIDGFVFRPDDVQSLTEKIAYLAKNRKKCIEMGQNAHERAKEYSWEKYKKRLKEILQVINNG